MYRNSSNRLLQLLAVFAFLGLFTTAATADSKTTDYDPVAVLLTWQQDPTTTMTIDWHTTVEDNRTRVLQFQKTGENAWQSRSPNSFPFPHSDRTIHRVELTGLTPGSTYNFRFGDDSRAYSFRTMPADASRPVRFAAGGDMQHNPEFMLETNLVATSYDVDFIVIGGDLAYADGRPDRAERWYTWFEAYKNGLITAEGRVIPILPALGNHEVQGGDHHRDDHDLRKDGPPYTQDDASRARIAPYFYTFFAFPGQPGYNVLDFGDYMSIISLDSDHSNPIDGAQTQWLDRTLAARTRVPHVFPQYHVPGFPSVRGFNGTRETRVRENWVPLFEKHGVRVVFENHDHAYKRTHPLRDGKIDPTGIVYIGDGCWGTNVRELRRDDDGNLPWYLTQAASIRHVIVATIHGPHQHFLMVSHEGDVIDEYPEVPRVRTPGQAAR